MRCTHLTTALAVVLLSLALTASADARGVLDAHNSTPSRGGGAVAGKGFTLYQTFTAEHSGPLDSASFDAYNAFRATEPTFISVYAVDGSERLSGAALATAPLSADGSASFTSPATVVAGDRYAFAATTAAKTGWVIEDTTPAINGWSEGFVNSAGDAFTDQSGTWIFSAYVTASPDAVVDSHETAADTAKWRKKTSRKTLNFCRTYKGPYDTGICGAYTKSAGALTDGQTYTMNVTGQANVWGGIWDNGPCGTSKPEKLDDDEYAGADAAFTYSVPKQSKTHHVLRLGKLCKQLKANGPLRGVLQYSLDNGATWQYFTPYDQAPLNTDHKYTTYVTGQGYAPQFRVPDIGPSDNHGSFHVTFDQPTSAR